MSITKIVETIDTIKANLVIADQLNTERGRHINLLTEGIHKIAVELGIIRPDSAPNGPEYLMLIEDILYTIKVIKEKR